MGWPGHNFTYLSVSEEKAASELERLAAPKVFCNGTVHAASFQPHPEKHSQDQYVTTKWDLKYSGIWKFRAVFDGDETVDFTFATLSTPSLVISGKGNDQASASALSSSAPTTVPTFFSTSLSRSSGLESALFQHTRTPPIRSQTLPSGMLVLGENGLPLSQTVPAHEKDDSMSPEE
ncbi:hypothetical protein BT96DRAFT_1003728 [Gymnopus androsaceus JB14]|uniref:Uncharacterized protein n=1 Tax=Gymnopus androsaceus JB14 TaxID=1447944 RepID=A0A6A4GTB6_9AGAR|nr:hypothetical protein BT96DRAFT_1003728 [Gymnopus androsaceus JB14]